MASKLAGSDVGPLYVSCLYMDFFCIVKSPVQMSGAGVRLILRSMSGSVQLKNLRLKSLTSKYDMRLHILAPKKEKSE